MDPFPQLLIADVYRIHPFPGSHEPGFEINIFTVSILDVLFQFAHDRRSSSDLKIIHTGKDHA